MKILFVLSGNTNISNNHKEVLVKNAKIQGDSLIMMGYNVDYYYIKGKGIFGYLKNLPGLCKTIKNNSYDIIHAHYSYTAILTSFATRVPLVVSLMGSDVFSNHFLLFFYKLLIKYRWDATIVKTKEMKDRFRINALYVIPNGVDIEVFKPMPKKAARDYLNLPPNKHIVLFASDPSRQEKNYELAKEAIKILKRDDIDLLTVFNCEHSKMVYYLNACDLVLLTSFWEGSANIIKEAMACNTKAVSTDVGDVKRNLNNLSGYYITSFKPEDVADKISNALSYNGNIKGFERLIKLGLDSLTINEKLLVLYKRIIMKNKQ